ncbi:MAG: hypothetical protein EON58_03380 [Alphaproteobacteria bacterium]|nr:MAG: hypothetical protein EON58_03380 [Alphaproteobacteria bacterium]
MAVGIAASLFFIGPSYAAQSSQGTAFQGLNWGATEAVIQRSFPEARRKKCVDDYFAELVAIAGQACDSPEVTPYEVAGIPFKLRFDLDLKTRRLMDVTLYYSADNSESSEAARTQFFARYDALVEALDARYGRSSAPLTRDKDGIVILLRSWRTPTSTVGLSMDLVTKKTSHTQLETYQIWYKPLGGKAAEKL